MAKSGAAESAPGAASGNRVARGRYAKGIAKQEEILRTALEVYANGGHKGTSLRDLADAAGLSQAGLLHYFGSKEQLFVEILRARDDVDTAALEDTSDVISVLIAVVRHNLDVPGLVELYAEVSVAAADPDHPGHEFFVERYRALRELIRGQVEKLQDEGRVDRALDPEGVATLMLAAADGLQTQWMLDPGIDMPARIQELWNIVASAHPQGG